MLANISCEATKTNTKQRGSQRSSVSRTKRVLSADLFREAIATIPHLSGVSIAVLDHKNKVRILITCAYSAWFVIVHHKETARATNHVIALVV